MDSTIKRSKQSTSSRPCNARRHLRGSDFGVYDAALALTAKKKGKRTLYASNETLANMTNYRSATVSVAKGRLSKAGWLKSLGGNRESGRRGKFEPNRYEILQHDQWAVTHPGECQGQGPCTVKPLTVRHRDRARSSEGTVHGRTGHNALSYALSDALKGTADAVPPSDGKEFRNLKPEGDPRYAPVVQFYFKEFGRRHPGVKPPFDGSDGKGLLKLLRQQPDATAEDILGWMANAFNSDDVPPLRPGWRLREFCAHATKFLRGPLKRSFATKTEKTGSVRSERETGKFDQLTVH